MPIRFSVRHVLTVVFSIMATVAFAGDPETVKPSVPVPPAGQPTAIARVNGRAIEAIDLKRAKTVMMAGQQARQLTAEQEKELDKQALMQLVSAELLYQAGQKLEIKDLDRLVEEKIELGKKRFPSKPDFEKAIKAMEMDEKDLRTYTRRDLVISTFIEQTMASKIVITEEEGKKFYEQNADKFKQDEAVKASHILIGVDPSATADDKKKAREKAEKLHKDLTSGADFATLAKQNSTCPSSQQGGDLGFFGRGRMVPAFEQAAFALKPGEISGVVETQFGFHIIKTVEKKKAETIAFGDAKKRIHDYLKGQKVSAAVNAYLIEARKTAAIEVLK